MKTITKFMLFVCTLSIISTVQAEWSQDRTREITTSLLESARDLVAVSENLGGQPDAVRNKFSHAAMVDLKLLIEEVDKLDVALAAGKNKAQTYAQYQRISNLRYSIGNYADDIEIPEDIRMKAQSAGDLIRQLDIIYME